MVPNLGNLDRAIRFLAGLVFFFAPLGNIPPIWSSSVLAYAIMAIGVILIATSLFRFCPLYRILGISTCKL
jgi:hypothetical protein